MSRITKNKYTKLKAPTGGNETAESEEYQDIVTEIWTEDDLEEAYHRSKLKTFLQKDPVMKIFKVKMQEEVHGPINPLPTMVTDLEVLKALMHLLHEVGMVAGNFGAETLFKVNFKDPDDLPWIPQGVSG